MVLERDIELLVARPVWQYSQGRTECGTSALTISAFFVQYDALTVDRYVNVKEACKPATVVHHNHLMAPAESSPTTVAHHLLFLLITAPINIAPSPPPLLPSSPHIRYCTPSPPASPNY
jgi:hypothetical protein